MYNKVGGDNKWLKTETRDGRKRRGDDVVNNDVT